MLNHPNVKQFSIKLAIVKKNLNSTIIQYLDYQFDFNHIKYIWYLYLLITFNFVYKFLDKLSSL